MAKTWAQALVKLKVLMATVKEVGKVEDVTMAEAEAGAVLAISRDRVRIPTDQDQRPGLLPTYCRILTDPLEATPVTEAMREGPEWLLKPGSIGQEKTMVLTSGTFRAHHHHTKSKNDLVL